MKYVNRDIMAVLDALLREPFAQYNGAFVAYPTKRFELGELVFSNAMDNDFCLDMFGALQ